MHVAARARWFYEPPSMPESAVVVVKIAAMFLVMVLGYVARRRGRVDAATTALLGALTADVCLPALTFGQLLATVDAARLRAGIVVPVLGALVILLGQLLGQLLRRFFATPAQAATFVFVAAMANWIYLPLPIVQALHGPAGVESLLLTNVGAQIVLWTAGVAVLRGGTLDRGALWALARNPGLVATAAGIAAALLLPRTAPAILAYPGKVLLEGVNLVGSLTIPLSLLVTGAQLGAVRLSARPSRAAVGITLIRLLIAPAVAIAAAWLARRAGIALPSPATEITVLVAGMPVAVSCGILTARYEQDTGLAAETIFVTTLGSIVTVPVVVWVFHRLV